jgi:hypothetical protein
MPKVAGFHSLLFVTFEHMTFDLARLKKESIAIEAVKRIAALLPWKRQP